MLLEQRLGKPCGSGISSSIGLFCAKETVAGISNPTASDTGFRIVIFFVHFSIFIEYQPYNQ
jgi:hypothetical protein